MFRRAILALAAAVASAAVAATVVIGLTLPLPAAVPTTGPAPTPTKELSEDPRSSTVSGPTPQPRPEVVDIPRGTASGPRHEFARVLAQVKVGMPEQDVLALLGKPDDIRTKTDAGGISTTRTREIWRYGTDGHLTFPTLGSIYIDNDGKAQYIYGGRGEPPPPDMFPENQLRSLLRLIDTAPTYNASDQYNPLPVIQIVNALQPLGKEKALAAIGEYLRVASDFHDGGREGVFLVLRVLFDVPADPGHMPHMAVGAPWPRHPKDPKQLPHFPILLVDDVPLLLVSGYNLGGYPQQPESHLDFFQKHGQLRSKPLVPGNNPLALMDAWAKNAGWLYEDDTNRGKQLIANQLLALIDTVHRRETDRFGYRFSPDGDVDKAWNAVAAEIAKLSIRWNSGENQYVFKDGTRLPDRVRKEYRRHIWKVEGLNGDAELILERRDEKNVWLCLVWASKNRQRLPAFKLTVTEVGEKNSPNRLGTASISGAGGNEGQVFMPFHIEVPDGAKLQARLLIGEREQVSPVFVP